VDDDANIRALLNTGLKHFGFTVWLAAGGREAADIYRQQQQHIRAAVLDVRMPDLDGPQTLQLLRAINPALPCCFMTGYAGHYTDDVLLAQGACHIFHKPFTLDEVGRIFQKMVLRPAPTIRPASAPATEDTAERRQAARHESEPVAVRIARAETPVVEAEGSVVNHSVEGFCLLASEAAETGTVLRVRPVDAGDPVPWVEVVVRYHLPHNDRWLLGCQFQKPTAPLRSLGGGPPSTTEA
jgi:CheY-like chemotaxis protein